jgi:hypothetical protein
MGRADEAEALINEGARIARRSPIYSKQLADAFLQKGFPLEACELYLSCSCTVLI